MKQSRDITDNPHVSSGMMPRVQGGQPLVGGPQINIEQIMQQFDETLAASPKTWQDDSETYTAIVRCPPTDVPRQDFPLGMMQDSSDEMSSVHSETYTVTAMQGNRTNRLSGENAMPHSAENVFSEQTEAKIPVDTPPCHVTESFSSERKKTQSAANLPYDERENSGALQMVAVDLFKSYKKGKLTVPVLKGVNLGIREGEMLAIVGQSGSGKSTLLHLLGTLDSPDSGSIHFDGQRIDSISNSQRDLLRNRFIGMIFQFYHLIPEMTTLENVLSPIMIRESIWGYMTRRKKYRQRAIELLERVGLGHRLRHKPSELSGGEMQRTAIARALISDPQILLADEPTGNLDLNSAKEVLQLLRDLNIEEKVTIVMVTHDQSIAQEADRTIRLVDGRVVR